MASLGPSITTETSSGETRPRQKLRGVGRAGNGCGQPSFCLSICLGYRNFPLEPQELATPTLLLWGKKDPYFDQGLVGAISSRFVPGRLEAHILPDMGHWIPQSHPKEMHEYMWAFLQDLLD